jgi:hypothetical protein
MVNNPVYLSTREDVNIIAGWVIFYNLAPTSLSWCNACQDSYYIVNATSGEIPLAAGVYYLTSDFVQITSILPGKSVFIVHDVSGVWLEKNIADYKAVEASPIDTTNPNNDIIVQENTPSVEPGEVPSYIPYADVIGAPTNLSQFRNDVGYITATTAIDRIYNEIPSGPINGSNATFTTAFDFEPETVVVIVNGVEQKPGLLYDYVTVGTKTIILNFSPNTGESVTVNYTKTS